MITKTVTPLQASGLRPGDVLAEMHVVPSTVQLFRYSAVTWNTHRIHFDHEYARDEGYPTVLVQSHLHGAFVTTYCTDLAGPDGVLLELDLSVRRYAVPGDHLVIKGTVSQVIPSTTDLTVHLDIEEVRVSDGAVCVPATAVLRIPNDRRPGEKRKTA